MGAGAFCTPSTTIFSAGRSTASGESAGKLVAGAGAEGCGEEARLSVGGLSAAGVVESAICVWPGRVVSSGAFTSSVVEGSVVAGVSPFRARGAGVSLAGAGAGDLGGDAAELVPLVIEPTSGVWPFVIGPLFSVASAGASVFTSAGAAGALLLSQQDSHEDGNTINRCLP